MSILRCCVASNGNLEYDRLGAGGADPLSLVYDPNLGFRLSECDGPKRFPFIGNCRMYHVGSGPRLLSYPLQLRLCMATYQRSGAFESKDAKNPEDRTKSLTAA